MVIALQRCVGFCHNEVNQPWASYFPSFLNPLPPQASVFKKLNWLLEIQCGQSRVALSSVCWHFEDDWACTWFCLWLFLHVSACWLYLLNLRPIFVFQEKLLAHSKSTFPTFSLSFFFFFPKEELRQSLCGLKVWEPTPSCTSVLAPPTTVWVMLSFSPRLSGPVSLP